MVVVAPITKYSSRGEPVMRKQEKRISTLKDLGKALSTTDLVLDLVPSSDCTEATLGHVGRMARTGQKVACIYVPTNGANVISTKYVRSIVEPIRDRIRSQGGDNL